ncbi:hypothetical protein TrVFT333_006286 [Trichoderma virens FT-333]|nr:hypothetical protein TrVFT333_006286 [Trichoderma virens FT-333]
MSPQIRDLLLPQLVQDRKSTTMDEGVSLEACDLSYVYYTTNSSSSDVASPLTPTFSNRGVPLRYSSSTSSLELPQVPPQEGPASPVAQHAAASKSSIRQLPDVQEEPLEREEEMEEEEESDDDDDLSDNLGMYCLCDQACEHHNTSQELLHGEMAGELDIDYDLGFLSDSDFSGDSQYPKKKGIMSGESTFTAITSRLGSRFPSIARWKSQRKANSITGLMTSPTTERSLENVLSGAASSRSSSMSSPTRQFPVLLDDSPMPPPAMPYYETYESTDSLDMHSGEFSREERSGIERDRAMATTPLLPPLMTDPLGKPPQPSPLQSPSIAPSPAVTEVHSPRVVPTPRQSVGSKPSMSSLRHVSVMTELPLPLPPSILQDQDEWSDRLGHANFTISPMPYGVDELTAESVTKFCDDWDAARVAYTKHLVRTGEHYGQTSKTYGMTEAKWAEIERKWKGHYTDIVRRTQPMTTASVMSRSRSRGRGRGRSESAYPSRKSQSQSHHDDIYAAMQWRGRRGCLPSAVPQMLEALDAEGKFPGRGDEDIVGPMQRDAYMVRARSEEKTPRFWKNLAEKLRL